MKTMLLASLLDGALQAVIIVFMLFLCALCLFAVVVIVRDIIHENANIHRERIKNAPQPSVEAETRNKVEVKEEPKEVVPSVETETAVTVAQEPATAVFEPVEEVSQESSEQPSEETQKGIVFSKRFSMAEKYATLSSEYKAYFDDVARYALSKSGVKEHKYNASYDYKDGVYRVIRLMIRRGEIICEFSFIDHDLRNYVNSSVVRIKQSATTIKLDEPSAVGATKDGIDLICSQIAKDREYKKELAKAKRRAKRQEQKQSEGARDESANE